MKKTVKAITVILLVIMIINKIMFLKKVPDMGKKYRWKYGNISYRVFGDKSAGKPPLLLLHSLFAGSGRHEFEKNIKALAVHFNVYAIDLPGYGLSDKPKMTYTAYIYTKLILDFIKDVIKEPAHVMAANGSAAFTVMANALDEDLFKKIMLINPTGFNDILPLNKDKWVRKLMESPVLGTVLYSAASSKTGCKGFLKKYCFTNTNMVNKRMINRYYQAAHANGTGGKYAYGSYFSHFMNMNIEKQLKTIKAPVYIVWGGDLAATSGWHFHAAKELKPKAQTAVFEKTKLFPHVENYKAFNDICSSFFLEP